MRVGLPLEQGANAEGGTAATRKRPLGSEPTTPTRPLKMRRLVAVPPKQGKHLQQMASQLGHFKLSGSPKRKARKPRKLRLETLGESGLQVKYINKLTVVALLCCYLLVIDYNNQCFSPLVYCLVLQHLRL